MVMDLGLMTWYSAFCWLSWPRSCISVSAPASTLQARAIHPSHAHMDA